VIAAALTAPGSTGAAVESCPDADADASAQPVALGRLEASTLCLVNRARIDRHVPPLRPNGKLTAAAAGHSQEMSHNDYFGHNSPNGSDSEERITAGGYLKGAGTWLLGENIGAGTSDLGSPRSLVNAWMNSPEHRRNMLNPRFREIGIGMELGDLLDPRGGPTVFVTADFGAVSRD
jgi:uncharacterized protein YkwD